jgi:hypothetical protein
MSEDTAENREMGTDSLVNKYKADTPGQGTDAPAQAEPQKEWPVMDPHSGQSVDEPRLAEHKGDKPHKHPHEEDDEVEEGAISTAKGPAAKKAARELRTKIGQHHDDTAKGQLAQKIGTNFKDTKNKVRAKMGLPPVHEDDQAKVDDTKAQMHALMKKSTKWKVKQQPNAGFGKKEDEVEEGAMKRAAGMDRDPTSDGKPPMDTFKKKPKDGKDKIEINPKVDEASKPGEQTAKFNARRAGSRQMKDPKKEMMVHHPKTGVKVIDKKDWKMHQAGGYNQAEQSEIDADETIDEVSRATLASYQSKASDARGHKGLPIKKVDNRYTYVKKASDKLEKLNKEGVEAPLRGTLEPGGVFKHAWLDAPVDVDADLKEAILGTLDEAGFKARYGDRWESVMHATANRLVIAEKKKLDKVDHSALKGDHDDREDGDIDNDGDEDKSDKYLHNRRKKVKKEIDQEEADEGVMGTGYKVGRNVTKAAGHVAMGVGKAAVRKGERTKNVVKGVKKAGKQLMGNNLQRVFTKEHTLPGFHNAEEFKMDPRVNVTENHGGQEGYVGGAIGGAIGLAHGAPIAGAKIGSTVGDIAAVGAAAYAAHKVYKIGKGVFKGSKKAGSVGHKIFKKVQNKHIKTKKGKELHNSFDWEMEVMVSEEQFAEMEESMSIHVTPHKNGTHYTVKKVGSAMKKHGGIKKGEHLSDTEIDDAGGSGIKVHHEAAEISNEGENKMSKVQETAADKYAAFMTAQNKAMSPSNARSSITVRSVSEDQIISQKTKHSNHKDAVGKHDAGAEHVGSHEHEHAYQSSEQPDRETDQYHVHNSKTGHVHTINIEADGNSARSKADIHKIGSGNISKGIINHIHKAHKANLGQ